MVAAAAKAGVPIYTSSPGDSSIGMNVAYHELMNGSRLMVDPNKDVNEVCSFILAGKKNGCVILGGGSPKNFYLQGQPTLWEVYGIPKGGNDYFIQITTDSVVWGGLSGATPAEAVSWGKVNPGVLPDTVVAYADSTIAFPLFCEYAVGATHNRRPLKGLVHKRDELGGGAQAGSAAGARRQAVITARWAHWPPSSALTSTERRSSRASTWTPTCPLRIVHAMRGRLKWDVLYVMEHDDLRRATDGAHFRLARQLRRTLVTLDRDYLDDQPVSRQPKAAASWCCRRRARTACCGFWPASIESCCAARRRRSRVACRSRAASCTCTWTGPAWARRRDRDRRRRRGRRRSRASPKAR